MSANYDGMGCFGDHTEGHPLCAKCHEREQCASRPQCFGHYLTVHPACAECRDRGHCAANTRRSFGRALFRRKPAIFIPLSYRFGAISPVRESPEAYAEIAKTAAEILPFAAFAELVWVKRHSHWQTAIVYQTEDGELHEVPSIAAGQMGVESKGPVYLSEGSILKNAADTYTEAEALAFIEYGTRCGYLHKEEHRIHAGLYGYSLVSNLIPKMPRLALLSSPKDPAEVERFLAFAWLIWLWSAARPMSEDEAIDAANVYCLETAIGLRGYGVQEAIDAATGYCPATASDLLEYGVQNGYLEERGRPLDSYALTDEGRRLVATPCDWFSAQVAVERPGIGVDVLR
jgi:hypothetical protein